MQHVFVPNLPWEEQRSPTGKFRSFSQNISIALGGIRNGGTWCGGHPFDLQIRRIPPGTSVCPFHAHLAQWELFVIESGTAVVRAGDETHTFEAGEVFIHPPGEPHQLTNGGDRDLVVLIVTDNPPLDAFFYPDSNKWGLRPPGKYFRMQEVGYFDGEEPAAPDAPPYRPSASPAPPATTPFARRHLRPDALPWVGWTSDKGKFRGSSKELSLALGAVPNAPTGLGGHPFDLELSKLAPGETGSPFHSHAAQWELFYIRRGTATTRAGNDRHTFRAGDVVLHPPGEPHQILNASATDELEFWLIADNPPVDYWHYPDSKKWGMREPRMFFRPEIVDYWHGEE